MSDETDEMVDRAALAASEVKILPVARHLALERVLAVAGEVCDEAEARGTADLAPLRDAVGRVP